MDDDNDVQDGDKSITAMLEIVAIKQLIWFYWKLFDRKFLHVFAHVRQALEFP